MGIKIVNRTKMAEEFRAFGEQMVDYEPGF